MSQDHALASSFKLMADAATAITKVVSKLIYDQESRLRWAQPESAYAQRPAIAKRRGRARLYRTETGSLLITIHRRKGRCQPHH